MRSRRGDVGQRNSRGQGCHRCVRDKKTWLSDDGLDPVKIRPSLVPAIHAPVGPRWTLTKSLPGEGGANRRCQGGPVQRPLPVTTSGGDPPVAAIPASREGDSS